MVVNSYCKPLRSVPLFCEFHELSLVMDIEEHEVIIITNN